jgi:hypothetical protein
LFETVKVNFTFSELWLAGNKLWRYTKHKSTFIPKIYTFLLHSEILFFVVLDLFKLFLFIFRFPVVLKTFTGRWTFFCRLTFPAAELIRFLSSPIWITSSPTLAGL